MNTSDLQQSSSGFGRRKDPPVVTFTANGKVRKFTIRPLTYALCGSAFMMFIVGYFAATAYLILRDDLIGATIARNARMQHTYEDRIAALRTQIDRITSRQMIDQKAMETRLDTLMKRQRTLGARQGIVAAALGKAGHKSAAISRIPVPSFKPNSTASSSDSVTTGAISPEQPKLRLGSLVGTNSPFTGGVKSRAASVLTAYASQTPVHPAFSEVENGLKQVEKQQIAALEKLRSTARGKMKRIARALSPLGVNLPTSNTAMGGPSIELKGSSGFATQMQALDDALKQLERVKSVIHKVPLGSPVPGQSTSSRYGSRIDPFTKRFAMHSGMDFRATYGHPVKATASGLVVKARRQGGYGKMVEIEHGNGLKTRYAHLHRIKVKEGQRVRLGQIVGQVGSTGRSTGPHLHYEVRRNGQAINPAKFVSTRTKINSIL